MELGIGLPNTVPGTTGPSSPTGLAPPRTPGFSSLGTIDRIVFPNYEPVVALSAAAAVTERIRLVTDVMLGPLRVNPAMVAKQFLSLDALAGGDRAVLGIGLGGTRGRLRDQRPRHVRPRRVARRRPGEDPRDLERRRRAGVQGRSPPDRQGPDPAGRRLRREPSFERAAKYGDGWTQGGSGASEFGATSRTSTTPGRRPAARASPGRWLSATSASGPTPRRTPERLRPRLLRLAG